MYKYFFVHLLNSIIHFIIIIGTYFVLLLCSAISLTAKLACPSGSSVVTVYSTVENLKIKCYFMCTLKNVMFCKFKKDVYKDVLMSLDCYQRILNN